MATKLSFPHKAEPETVCRELEKDLRSQSIEHGLELTQPGARTYRLKRTGADLTFVVTETTLDVDVDLSWFVPGSIKQRVVNGLNEGLPKLLRRCEEG